MQTNSSAGNPILLRLLVFIASVLIVAAVLSPLLFFLAQECVRKWPDAAVSQVLDAKEFPSYFSRAAMLAAFLGLIPLLKSVSLTWSQVLGRLSLRSEPKFLLAGFGLAAIGILGMGWLCFLTGACRFRPEGGGAGWFMPVISGLTVSIIEELLFRGAILMLLTRSLGTRAGLWWTSGIFALVHFLKPPADGALPDGDVTWSSGFWVITQLFRGFGDWEHFMGEFVLLLTVGWALGAARQRTGALALSIGLHAGWVASMKYFGQIVKVTAALNAGELAPWMVRNTCRAIVSPIVGIVPVIAVMLTAFAALRLAVKLLQREKAIASAPSNPH